MKHIARLLFAGSLMVTVGLLAGKSVKRLADGHAMMMTYGVTKRCIRSVATCENNSSSYGTSYTKRFVYTCITN